jgi:hypothetical protein
MDALVVFARRVSLVRMEGSPMTRLALFVVCCLLVVSCKTTGPAGDRFSYRYQWLSYLAGDDIREFCSLGSQDRLRLIYNADFNNQTRTYDFVASSDGSSALTSKRWVGSSTILVTGGDLIGALDPQSSQGRVSAGDMVGLVDLLDQSAFYEPAPTMALRSDDYFWSGVACLNGQFHVQAYPRDRLGMVAFAGYLEKLDPLGIVLPPVQLRDLPALNSLRGNSGTNAGRSDSSALYYAAEVRNNAISGRWLN